MWAALVCVWVVSTWSPSADQAPVSGWPQAARRPVLAIMSLEPGEFALRLEHHWGGLGASRVHFDDHDGPFEAVVERSAGGVRVIFNGWEEHPFTASSKKVRVVYRSLKAEHTDFVAEATPDGGVQLKAAGRPPIRGSRISVRLGVRDARYLVTKAKRASGD